VHSDPIDQLGVQKLLGAEHLGPALAFEDVQDEQAEFVTQRAERVVGTSIRNVTTA